MISRPPCFLRAAIGLAVVEIIGERKSKGSQWARSVLSLVGKGAPVHELSSHTVQDRKGSFVDRAQGLKPGRQVLMPRGVTCQLFDLEQAVEPLSLSSSIKWGHAIIPLGGEASMQ